MTVPPKTRPFAPPASAKGAPEPRDQSAAAGSGEPAAPFDGQPVEHLRQVLAQASERKPGRRLLVLTHRSPDPDGLGACEGMRFLCGERFGHAVDVATVGRIHRAENLAMVRALELDLLDYNQLDLTGYFGVVLVDSQPQFGHTVVPDELPMLAVFDHHVPPDSGAALEVPHQDVRLGVGASSSIVFEYLRDAGGEFDPKTASALFCGVRYDTADLSRNGSPLDEEAYFETFRRCDRNAIAQIAHPSLPRDYYTDLHAALAVARQYGSLVIALLSRVSHPEFVAEMADFFLRMKGCSWVLVGGAYQENGTGSYVLSLRTDYSFGHAYPLMKRILDGKGSFGGHGHIAGGRIPLDDLGESTIACVERELRKNALAILGNGEEDGGLPLDGRELT